MGERPKMFAPSDVHYFFRKIFYLLPKFSDEVPTGDLFFALHPGFSGFQEDFPVTFARKWEKMTLSTLGSKPQNERKLTPKWEKIKSKFSKAGGPPPHSRRHCSYCSNSMYNITVGKRDRELLWRII
jgi:hypothetical protein